MFNDPTIISRNWFRGCDIAAAFLVAVVERRRVDTLFWYDELLESYNSCAILDLLRYAWLLCGPACLPPLDFLTDLRLVLDILLERPRLPLFNIILLVDGSIPGSLNGSSSGKKGIEGYTSIKNGAYPSSGSKNQIEGYYERAISNKNALAACWAALRMPFGEIEPYNQIFKPYEYICMKILLGCAVGDQGEVQVSHKGMEEQSIPERGREWIKKCPILPPQIQYFVDTSKCKEVFNPLDLCTNEQIYNSHYWRSYMIEMGMEDVWESDETMEDFTEHAFPDDIPDEWSHEDRNKLRLLGCEVGAPWYEWFHKWIPMQYYKKLVDLLSEKDNSIINLIDNIDYNNLQVTDADKKKMAPIVIKKFVE